MRNLILNQHVSHLCTTDDPVDDLHCHLALQKEDFACRVLPSFRPDRAVHLEKPDFPEYVEKLAAAAGQDDCIRGGYGCVPSPAASTSSSPPAALLATTASRAASMCHARLLRRMPYLKIA
mgnify:CR=1 FL=1